MTQETRRKTQETRPQRQDRTPFNEAGERVYFGDDPHAAEFPDLTGADIRVPMSEVTLTVGQRKVKKTVNANFKRR